jgi:hypothetical protein
MPLRQSGVPRLDRTVLSSRSFFGPSNRPPTMYNFASPPGLPEDARARQARLHARALEVFGNADLTWLHRWDPKLGLNEIGAPSSPHQYAALGEPQLVELLRLLDELAVTVMPRWEVRIRSRPNRRR